MTSKTDNPDIQTGLLLVTHSGIADALLTQARRILGSSLTGIAAFEVDRPGRSAQDALRRARREADQGQGVLVLTDLPGATPANMALGLRDEHCRVISGLSLPMLIRAWNYREQPLPRLTQLALEGACSAAVELS